MKDFVSPVSRSHVGECDHEPGMGCGHPVVGRRGGHGGEVRHVEHGAPLDLFRDRHDLSSDLDLSLTPSAETIIGHSRIETTKNIYGHLFAQDRAFILKAINQPVSRLHVHGDNDEDAA